MKQSYRILFLPHAGLGANIILNLNVMECPTSYLYKTLIGGLLFIAGILSPSFSAAYPGENYNVFTLRAKITHNHAKCPDRKTSGHVWLNFGGRFASANDEALGCFSNDYVYENIQGIETRSVDIPLHSCRGYYPEFEFRLDDYFLCLELAAIGSSHNQGGGSGSGIPTIEVVDNEQYHPYDPNMPIVKIPIRKMLQYGYRTVHGCETIELSLQTKCDLSVSQTETEFVGYPYVYRIQASANCPANSGLEVSPACYIWEYAHKDTDGFIPLPHTGPSIRIETGKESDFPMGENILIKIADGKPSSPKNTQTIYFYPQIPQPTRTPNQIIPEGQEFLQEITLGFNRKLLPEAGESFTTVSLYSQVASGQNGQIDLNESRIIHQHQIPSSQQPVTSFYTFRVPDNLIKEGTYYVTVEGKVRGKGNRPDLVENKNLPEDIKTAMFQCVSFTVKKNQVAIDRVDFIPPACYGEKGSVQVTLKQSFHMPFQSLPSFFVRNRSGEFETIPFECLSKGSSSNPYSIFLCRQIDASQREFKIVLPNSYGSSSSSGSSATDEMCGFFDIRFTQPDKLYVPVEKKDNSGYYYEDDRIYAASDGNITVHRSKARNGTPPYAFSYLQENISLVNRMPLRNDLLPTPNGGTFRIFMEDDAGCSFDTLLYVGNLNKYLKVDLEIVQNISCYNANDGMLKAKIIYQSSDQIEYKWYKNGMLMSGKYGAGIDNLGPGTYKVVLFDRSTGMSASRQVSLTQPPALSIQTHSIGDVSCHGMHTGYIGLKGLGGTPPYLFSWEDGVFGDTRSDLPAGIHTLKMTDLNGCFVQKSYPISEPEAPFRLIIDSVIHAHYDSEGNYMPGKVLAHGEGGTPPYGWLYCNPYKDPDALDSGSYLVFQWDALHCQSTEKIEVGLYDKMRVEIIQERENLCFEAEEAACRVRIEGGVPPFNIQWNTGETTERIENLPAGPYEVRVSDAAGVTRQAFIEISRPPRLEIEVPHLKTPDYYGCIDHDCPPNAANGEIGIRVSGGTPPYSYRWEKDGRNYPAGENTASLSRLSAGNYTVHVTDARLCSLSRTMTLDSIPALQAEIEIRQPINCFGQHSGILAGKATGGTPPYKFFWENPAENLSDTNIRIANLPAGEYLLNVTDALGIVSRVSLPLEQAPLLRIVTDRIRIPSYPGSENGIPVQIADDGLILTHAEGGTPPYRYLWSNPEQEDFQSSQAGIENLKPGHYRLQLTDRFDCPADTVFVLPQIPPLLASIGSDKPVSCYGDNDARLKADIRGGTPPYRLYWFCEDYPAGKDTVGKETFSLENIGIGTYRLEVRDSLSVSASCRIAVAQPDSLQLELAVQTSPCTGDSAGSAKAVILGGSTPYEYRWYIDGSRVDTEDSVILHIENADISLHLTDARGCRTFASTDIVAPPALQLEYSLRNPSYAGSRWQNIPQAVADGDIRLSVRGGTPPYRYYWNTGDTTGHLLHADSGNYHVRIEDSHGCALEKSFRLNRTETLSTQLHLISVPLCANERTASFSLSIRGGVPPYTFDWYRNGNWIGSDTTRFRQQRPSGLYRVEIRDANGILSTDSLQIDQPAPLTASAGITHASAWHFRNGAIQVSIQGGQPPYSIFWNNGSTDSVLHGIGRGEYALDIYDANLCHQSFRYTVSSPDSLFIASFIMQHVSAPGAEDAGIHLDIQGGLPPYTYRWEDAQGQLLEEGRHTGRSLQLENLREGLYRFHLTDSGGARIDRLFEVETNTALEAVLMLENPIRCHGEANACIRAWIQGGKSPYTTLWESWSDSLQSFIRLANQDSLYQDRLPAGSYRLRVWDNSDDSASAVLIVTQPEKLALTAEIIPQQDRSDAAEGKFRLFVQGGSLPYQYLWNTGNTTSEQAFFREESYSVQVTDARGCRISYSPDSLLSEMIQTDIIETAGILCPGEPTGSLEAVIQNGKPPFRYYWSNGDTSFRIENLKAGYYSLVVQDALGKTDSCLYRLHEPPALQNRIETRNPSCAGFSDGKISLYTEGGTGPYTYAWNTGDYFPDLFGLKDGRYIVRTLDRQQCLRLDTVYLQEPEVLYGDLHIDTIVCHDGKGRIRWFAAGGTPPYRYDWKMQNPENPEAEPEEGTAPVIDPARTGRYRLVIQDSQQCRFDTTVYLANPKPPRYSLLSQKTLCLGQTLSIRAEGSDTIPNLTYLWQFPDNSVSTLPEIETRMPGLHRLTLIQNQQCFYRDSILIRASGDSIEAEFWVSSRISAEQSCLLVNISAYRPDSIRWHLPPGTRIIMQDGNYLEAIFPQTGLYTVGMTSFKGACSESAFRQIRVEMPQNGTPGEEPDSEIQWTVRPNPIRENGQLTGRSENPVKAKYRLIRAFTGQLYEQGALEIPAGGQSSATLFRKPCPSGLYILLIEYGTERHFVKLIKL